MTDRWTAPGSLTLLLCHDQAIEESLAAAIDPYDPKVASVALSNARAAVKTIKGSYALEANTKAALLWLEISDGQRTAEEARVHARSALEYLASVVEFDGFDDFDYNYEGKFAREASVDKLVYCRRAVQAARTELGRFIAAFDAQSYSEAEAIYRDAMNPSYGPLPF